MDARSSRTGDVVTHLPSIVKTAAGHSRIVDVTRKDAQLGPAGLFIGLRECVDEPITLRTAMFCQQFDAKEYEYDDEPCTRHLKHR